MKSGEQLSQNALIEFKTIYRDEFGVTLSEGEMQELAIRLLRFFDMLSKPILDKGKKSESSSTPLV